MGIIIPPKLVLTLTDRLWLSLAVMLIAGPATVWFGYWACQDLWPRVTIDCVAEQADVIVDGQHRGRTPCTIRLGLKEHKLDLYCLGYKSMSVPLDLTDGARPGVFKMQDLQGVLDIRVQPAGIGAHVRVRGEDPARGGSSTFLLDAGDYTVEVAAAGYHSRALPVTIERGARKSVAVSLTWVGVGTLLDFYVPTGWTARYEAPVSDRKGLRYAWNLGDGTRSTAVELEHSFATCGTYVTSLYVTTAEGDLISRTCHTHVSPGLRSSGSKGDALPAWVDAEFAELAFTPVYSGGRLAYQAGVRLHVAGAPPTQPTGMVWYRVELTPRGEDKPSHAVSLMFRRGNAALGEPDAWHKEWLTWTGDQWIAQVSATTQLRHPNAPVIEFSVPVPASFDASRGFKWRARIDLCQPDLNSSDGTDEMEYPLGG
jgi:hypothetical protein